MQMQYVNGRRPKGTDASALNSILSLKQVLPSASQTSFMIFSVLSNVVTQYAIMGADKLRFGSRISGTRETSDFPLLSLFSEEQNRTTLGVLSGSTDSHHIVCAVKYLHGG